MSKINVLALFSLLVFSLSAQGKEYLGFDLGNDTFDEIVQILESKNIPYTLRYTKDMSDQDIKSLQKLEFKSNTTWEKYGKVNIGTLFFTEGKLSTIYVQWIDKSDSILAQSKDLIKVLARKQVDDTLYKSLDKAFRKKYKMKSLPTSEGVVHEGFYHDDKAVDIRLRREMEYPTSNPLDDYYVTSVTYWDNDLYKKGKEIIAMNNKKVAEENRKHDPDLLFAKDF